MSPEPGECLRLIAPGGIGRVAFSGSHGPTVLPVNYVPDDDAATVSGADVTPWAGGDRHLYIRIAPHQITGRRIHGL
ncbi:pyridoxamine 5'-phosphate oxidase family protein [Nonomuraea fuscirosea]|uniref:pyridoxamine 5'-phosphate oxidase family protein n=1 Tax=Nonomuraea fuscirosea TaxID=1291556 RepID=UPI003711A532